MSKYGKTQSQSHFSKAVHADIQRSTFLRNSTLKTSFNCGDIVPIYVDEVLPGDTFNFDIAFISRLTTPIFPTMDVLNLDFYAFFVPNRIVWDGWEELNGENKSSAWIPENPPALVPVFSDNFPIPNNSIGDYYGLPPLMKTIQVAGVNALPFRGYALIYNEWFRDQNLQAPLIINKGDDEESHEYSDPGLPYYGVRYQPHLPLLKANKKHDYFTSCLPSPQKGASVLLPIEFNELIPVISTPNHHFESGPAGSAMAWQTEGGSPLTGRSVNLGTNFAAQTMTTTFSNFASPSEALKPSNLWADIRGVPISGSTISELRTAFQIQKLYERDARGGTRYVEMLKAHFGVDAQDYRLQRPEFLGHHHSYVGMQQVAQTSSSDWNSPQGNLAAYSYTSQNRTSFFKKSFVEHGFVHVFVVARHPKTYQQGLDKMWSRRDRFDYYYPALAHISEQPVLNKEIFVQDTDFTPGKNSNEEVFGYNEPWADYRYKPNRTSGQMRSGFGNSLDAWHYGDYYEDTPTLSSEWIEDNSHVNVGRTLAISDEFRGQIDIDIAFLNKATRPMPVYGVPGLVDHF